MTIITLLSDFGSLDGYVAQMKAVILGNSPTAVIVDISHEIRRHDIAMGSYVLETASACFPKRTIHVAVVDPDVGGRRKALVIDCNSAIFVGPDNGLLDRASERLGRRSVYEIRHGIHGRHLSTTFHGRDIFAHVAGLIASGKRPEEIGSRITGMEELDRPLPVLSKGSLVCHVLHVDHFGNVITDIDEDLSRKLPLTLGGAIQIRSKKDFRARYVISYHNVLPGNLAVVLGSQGFMEIAVREGSAKEKLKVKPMDKIELRF